MSGSRQCNYFLFYSENKDMITFVLKRKWFEKIASGEKKIEFRECKRFWNSRIMIEGADLIPIDDGYLVRNTVKECMMTNGYTADKLFADIEKIEIWATKKNDLGTNPVYAIYLKNVRRKK